MRRNLVLTIGNGMMGDDGAGALLAEKMSKSPLEEWDVLNGGAAPENVLHLVRKFAPERVLLVDAADMDLPPGSIRHIQDEELQNPFLLTTHTLPLTFLIEALRDFVPQVDLIGIQPEVVAFGYPMSSSVTRSIDSIYNSLKWGEESWVALEMTQYE
jgi:hydrogenase 3 maturation protease